MKKTFSILAILIFATNISIAQKFAYVDTDYILGKIPEYQEAQGELNATSKRWQKEIERKYTEIAKMREEYKLEQILLTDDMKAKREATITEKLTSVQDLQKQRFGIDGDLFRKKQELVKPIQDKVFASIKAVAAKYSYSIVFDKASSITMLYSSKKLDKSNYVLKHMGYGKTLPKAKR